MPSSRIRCSSEIMQATCQEKIAVLSRESWLRSLCVIVIIPIDPIWYFSWGLPQNWSCLLWTMLNARKHLAPHTVHHPHDLLYIDQHRSSSLPESKKSHWWGKGEVGGKTPLKSNAKATVLERNAACPESGNVSNGSVRSIFLTISVQVGFTSSRWLERRKWRKAWRSFCLRVRRSYLVLGLANLCSLSAPMTMIGLIGMSYKDSSGEFRWCECVLDLIHLLMS